MPLYEYQCEACGVTFELIRKFSDPPLEACPTCGSGPVRKLVSSPAFQFKGSGWYITDYARKSGGEGAPASKDGEKPAAAYKADKTEKTDKTEKSDKAAGASPPTPTSSSSKDS